MRNSLPEQRSGLDSLCVGNDGVSPGAVCFSQSLRRAMENLLCFTFAFHRKLFLEQVDAIAILTESPAFDVPHRHWILM